MRGAQFLGGQNALEPGIIPADAGSTSDASKAAEPDPDHPRGCGEHGMQEYVMPEDEGSSPRMRGAPRFAFPLPPRIRIIPADAGSTMKGHANA